MKLTLPVAVVLALIANLIPGFGKQPPNQAQPTSGATPPAKK
jgi:hypothetical protein